MFGYEWNTTVKDKEIQCVYTDLMFTGQDLISKKAQRLLIKQCLCLAHHTETVLVPAHLSLSMFHYSLQHISTFSSSCQGSDRAHSV